MTISGLDSILERLGNACEASRLEGTKELHGTITGVFLATWKLTTLTSDAWRGFHGPVRRLPSILALFFEGYLKILADDVAPLPSGRPRPSIVPIPVSRLLNLFNPTRRRFLIIFDGGECLMLLVPSHAFPIATPKYPPHSQDIDLILRPSRTGTRAPRRCHPPFSQSTRDTVIWRQQATA
ncbi:hypothetical protein R3P38DRAFT_3216355 [Favolaschia claudopus]|uniref:Uncharacterized protein n=1 Tax=Favolaschia claudopus TaxID=2862362 RepID=A0AAW0A7Q5_9AGAR